MVIKFKTVELLKTFPKYRFYIYEKQVSIIETLINRFKWFGESMNSIDYNRLYDNNDYLEERSEYYLITLMRRIIKYNFY